MHLKETGSKLNSGGTMYSPAMESCEHGAELRVPQNT
jgi:hypothetical protein